MQNSYFQLIKPRIVTGNLISVLGAFLLASKGKVNYSLLFLSLLAASLVIASACIVNNILDKDIDLKMERTKNRAMVNGLISTQSSIIYATLLGIIGFSLFYFLINLKTMLLATVGYVIYVIVYSLYMKRNSIYATLVGSLAGAIPPVIGYCAVSNKFDKAALILLIIFVVWQIPHSYAIAIFRFQDYKNAQIPVLPVVKGIDRAKNNIIAYIILFIIATLMLTIEGYTGYKYLVICELINLCWLCTALLGYKTLNNELWARKIFLFSIINITIVSLMMSVDFVSKSI